MDKTKKIKPYSKIDTYVDLCYSISQYACVLSNDNGDGRRYVYSWIEQSW